jgi:hypothetical protein
MAVHRSRTSILDRTAIERLLELTNYLGSSGAMVDRVLAGTGE